MASGKGFDPVPSTLVIGEEVDRGSFGVVYLAKIDEKSVAVKQFHKVLMDSAGPEENVPLKNFKTECERLKDLHHPNVVRYIGAYEDKKGPLLVMELMYESLEKYLKRNKGRLSTERILEICSSVCEGMAYLHGRDEPLIHRDLCSKNVLLTKEEVVKIADFGQSKLLQNRTSSLMTTQPGTIAYMPPEALKKDGEYTAKVDSFSLGVLMLEICTQSVPSLGWDGINYVIEVIRREKDLSLLEDVHPLKPLVVWCLQHEKLRPAVTVIHNHVKDVCETSKIELQKLQREKDQVKKDFGELQKALERNEVQRGELNEKAEKAEEARREAVDEAKKLNEERKRLQESLEKERAEKREKDSEIQRLQRMLATKEDKWLKEKEKLKKELKKQERKILQNQSDFDTELRKDREAAAGKFAAREKLLMEKIRRAEEERDHFQALVHTKEMHIQEVEQENRTLKTQVEDTRQTLQEKQRMLATKEDKWLKEKEKLKKKLKELERKVKDLQSELEYKNTWSGWAGSLLGSSNK